jgi:hypothetical protein
MTMKHTSIVLLGVILSILINNVGVCQNTIALVDSFSQGNTNGWTWQTGSWTFADSQVSTEAQYGHHFLIQPNYIFNNLTFQADVMKLDDADAEHPALVFCWIDDTMNYVFRINGVGSQSWIQLVRDMDNRDMNAQIISTVPWYTDENDHRMYKGVWYTLKVQVESGNIKCKVWRTSDIEPTTCNLDVIDSLYKQGKIGLEYYTGAHKFDNVIATGDGTFITGIPENVHSNPESFVLGPNYPIDSRVTLKIYNVLGEVVHVLADEVQSAGYRSATWNAADVASGLYFDRLDAVSVADPSKSFAQVKKIMLLK